MPETKFGLPNLFNFKEPNLFYSIIGYLKQDCAIQLDISHDLFRFQFIGRYR